MGLEREREKERLGIKCLERDKEILGLRGLERERKRDSGLRA